MIIFLVSHEKPCLNKQKIIKLIKKLIGFSYLNAVVDEIHQIFFLQNKIILKVKFKMQYLVLISFFQITNNILFNISSHEKHKCGNAVAAANGYK